MSTSVTLPALGESVTEGTVSRWLKQVGDTVEADEPLLEVSTDKVDTEIPSPTSGVLLEIKAQEDETVEVGAVLAVIGDASEAGGTPVARTPAAGTRLLQKLRRTSRARKPPSQSRQRSRTSRRPRTPRRLHHQSGGGSGERHRRHPSGPGRERHRRHGEPLAQAGRRHGRGRRAPARGVHRQGRHRDSVADLRHGAGDPGPRGRDRRGRCGAGRRRRGRSSRTTRTRTRTNSGAGTEAGAGARTGARIKAAAAGRDRRPGPQGGCAAGEARTGLLVEARRDAGGQRLRRGLRHAAGPQAGQGAQRRPERGHRHRGRWSGPQAGRAGRRRGSQEGCRGPRRLRTRSRRRHRPQRPAHRRHRQSPVRCAARRRRCRGSARPSPSGWSSRCRSRRSSPRRWRST